MFVARLSTPAENEGREALEFRLTNVRDFKIVDDAGGSRFIFPPFCSFSLFLSLALQVSKSGTFYEILIGTFIFQSKEQIIEK